AAEDLDRALGDPHRDLAGLELGHRSLRVLERNAVAPHPGGAPHQQARGVDLELHARERERDRLVLDYLAPELLALLRVLERVLIGRARRARDRPTRSRRGCRRSRRWSPTPSARLAPTRPSPRRTWRWCARPRCRSRRWAPTRRTRPP